MISGRKQYGGFFLQVGVGLLIMAGAAVVDMQWTIALSRFESPRLVAFMADSMFEGERPGANDVVTLVLLAAAIGYYIAWRWPSLKRIAPWRPQLGYMVTSAMVVGVFLIHSLKWIMGRARPDMVLAKEAAFSHWFTFGPLFVTDGVFHGAFPSGHTAQTMLLMAVAFALAGDPLCGKPVRMAGWIWGGLAVVFSLAMGATRCMTLSHWFTDVLGAIFLTMTAMYIIYHKVLQVPEQRRYMARYGRLPDLPEVWELVLCFYLFIGTLGLMMAIIGLRAPWIGKGPWLVLMVPVGAGMIWIARKQSTALLQKVGQALRLPLQTAQ